METQAVEIDADVRGAPGTPQHTLRAIARDLRIRAEDSGYGYWRPENPHDFYPDVECCTPEEIAAHKAACDAWDRGEYKPQQPPDVEAGVPLPAGVVSATMVGGEVVHATFAPWGIGTFTHRDEELLSHAARLEAVADALEVAL